MAQSVWIATPYNHHYKIVDVTSGIHGRASDLPAMAEAPNAPNAIIKAVALAAEKKQRVTSICRFNMDILLVVD
jgi:hypothetical protein